MAKALTGGRRGGLIRHWDRSDSYSSEKVDAGSVRPLLVVVFDEGRVLEEVFLVVADVAAILGH